MTEPLNNSINVTPLGTFALEFTCNGEWPAQNFVRRIYLVNGSQTQVKFVIDSSPSWRYVDFLGTNWSIVQHEKVVNLGVSGRDMEWQGITPEFHQMLLGDFADLRALMQFFHVVGHDSIHVVNSFIPFQTIAFQLPRASNA